MFGTSTTVLEPKVSFYSVDDRGLYCDWIQGITTETLLREFRYYNRTQTMIYTPKIVAEGVACYDQLSATISLNKRVNLDKVVKIIEKTISDPEFVKDEYVFERKKSLNSFFLSDWNLEQYMDHLSEYYSPFGIKIPLAEQFEQIKNLNFKKFSDIWTQNFGRSMILKYQYY